MSILTYFYELIYGKEKTINLKEIECIETDSILIQSESEILKNKINYLENRLTILEDIINKNTNVIVKDEPHKTKKIVKFNGILFTNDLLMDTRNKLKPMKKENNNKPKNESEILKGIKSKIHEFELKKIKIEN